jgi:predicted RND superfamily exporter protein
MGIAILLVPILIMPFVFGRSTGAFLPQVTAILGLTMALGLMALGRLGVTRPYLVLTLLLVSTLVVGFSISRLHFSHNQLHFFTEDSDFMRQVRLIEAQAVGDVRLGLLAMIPNLLPVIIGLGVMGYLDIPLNTYNLIGGSIAIEPAGGFPEAI